MSRNDILAREPEIKQWVNDHQPKAYICRQLGCKPETLERYLSLMNISYSGNASRKGIRHLEQRKSALEYIKSSCVHSHILKQKLIEDGLKENKCELCGASIWLGQTLPLELHHIDGNHYNNNLDNLMVLCPNCHSLQNGNTKQK